MKKLIMLDEEKGKVKFDYYCDTCGIELRKYWYGVDFTFTAVDTDYHFCTYGHAIRFLAEEMRKQAPQKES